MSKTDHADEKRRLAEAYARMTDSELETLAQDMDSLTEVARQTLASEITRRGIAPQAPVTIMPASGPEMRQLVTVGQYRDLTDAWIAKGKLESTGIECFLVDDNMVRIDWFISNLLGGVKLKVNAEDAEEAQAILEQPIPEDIEVDGVGKYSQPRCERCQSLDVTFREFERLWKCESCKHEWRENADDNT